MTAAFAATEAANAAAAQFSGGAHEVAIWQEPEMWLVVAFLIFIGILAKPVYRRLTGSLDARSTMIRAELEEARKLREEAQAALAAYQRKQRDAAREAEEIVRHAEAEAKRITAEAEVHLAETLKRHEAMAQEKIARAESHALNQVRSEAVDVALAATRRLLEERIDEHKSDALLQTAIDELPARLH